jgi:hypothetical protein
MDEVLKEIMGESYKEGMSKDDVQNFFKKQVLSGGDYVNSGKANAEKKALNDQIANLQAELDSKMSDEDKKKKESADLMKKFQQMEKLVAEKSAAISKMSALAYLSEAKTQAGIQDGDTDFDNFISNIAFEDKEKTDNVSKYIASLVKNAYEAGKKTADKNELGKMGAFKAGSDAGSEEKGAFGKELAQSTKVETKGQKDFFERK